MPLEPTARTEQVQVLPLDQIRASPLNARSAASTERLADLADSMRTSGLQQPVVVRANRHGGDEAWELVFGHRRTMAARTLGWTTIPAIVRDMTDEQVVLAQAVENLQREDLSPMDEARGYRTLLDELKLPVDDAAPLVGRSRTQIYARLKLLELGPEAQAAVHQGRLDAEVAQLLARQPKSMQAELLEDLLEGDYDDEPFSYRKAKRMLAQHHAPLKAATFDLTEATYGLPKIPGVTDDVRNLGCAQCPYRSGNQPEAASDEDAEICLDTACFRAKGAAHAAREKARLAAQGAKVSKLGHYEARDKVRAGELIDLDTKDPAIDKKRTLREVLGNELAGAQIVDGTGYGNDSASLVMTPRALAAALKKAGIDKASSLVTKAEQKAEAPKVKAENEWDRRNRLAKAFEDKVRAALVPAVLAEGPKADDIRDVAKVVADQFGNAVDALEALGVVNKNIADAIDQLPGDQLGKFLVLAVALNGIDCMYADAPDAEMQSICTRYGVDLAAVRTEVYGQPGQPKKKGKK